MPTVAERLGYAHDARVLILHCDDLGFSYTTNVGVYESLRTGLATSASLMLPAPWAREAASRYRGEDVGVQLTVNAEHDLYRWAPITQAPSLLDGDGGFPRTVTDVWDHADLDELRRECRAQIERAVLWGFDISHLNAHLGTLQIRSEFFDVYLDLAIEFTLPIRLSGADTESLIGFPFRRLAAEEGVVFPDHFVSLPNGAGHRALIDGLADLPPGVTEIALRPAVDAPELRAIAEDWSVRVEDHRLLCHDEQFRQAVADRGLVLTGYRPLRDLMRGERVSSGLRTAAPFAASDQPGS